MECASAMKELAGLTEYVGIQEATEKVASVVGGFVDKTPLSCCGQTEGAHSCTSSQVYNRTCRAAVEMSNDFMTSTNGPFFGLASILILLEARNQLHSFYQQEMLMTLLSFQIVSSVLSIWQFTIFAGKIETFSNFKSKWDLFGSNCP